MTPCWTISTTGTARSGSTRSSRERLTTREAEIIRLRYGLGGTIPLTQREIAASFGISRSYVSRIEKRALEKLRQELQDGPAPQLVRRRPHSSGT